MPELNIINIKYGILTCSVNNALLNLIKIFYKQIIFNGRNNPKNISIELFKFKLREFRQIEYNIAKNKNKLVKHFQKWKNMDDF